MLAPEIGTGYGNCSRYTTFGSYLIFGLIYLAADRGRDWFETRPARSKPPWLAPVALVVFLGIVGLNYARSWKIYVDAGKLNVAMCDAYVREDAPDCNLLIFADNAYVVEMKSRLRHLGLGPYRPGVVPSWVPGPVVLSLSNEGWKPQDLDRPIAATCTCPVEKIDAIDVFL